MQDWDGVMGEMEFGEGEIAVTINHWVTERNSPQAAGRAIHGPATGRWRNKTPSYEKEQTDHI